MSGNGSWTQPWGDGDHTFRLRIGELRELEEKRNAGSFELCRRLSDGTWRVDDIRETLRLGLIGGGMSAPVALGLVAKYCGPTTLFENSVVARNVIMAAVFGDPDDVVGKIAAGILGPTADSTSEDEPNSRPSSAPAPQSVGLSTTSIEPLFGNSPQRSTAGSDATAPTINGRSL